MTRRFGKQWGGSPVKIIVLVVLFIVVPCAIGGYLLINFASKTMKQVADTMMPTVSCAKNFEYARDAMLDYANEKGALPPKENWQALIEPYYRKLAAKMDKEGGDVMGADFSLKAWPEGAEWNCKVPDGVTGVAYNLELAGKKLADIKNKSDAIVLFEVQKPGKNLALTYKEPPRSERPLFMMGERRDWFYIPLEGTGTTKSFAKDKNFKVDVNTKEEREAKPESTK